MRLLIVCAVVAAASSAYAAEDLRGSAPADILELDTLPGAGELFLDYCLVGRHVCVTVSTSCHGQCCQQPEADDIGYGCSGDVYGVIPPIFHYAGWTCKPYSPVEAGVKQSGEAGPVPGYIKQCTNRR